MYTIQTLLSFGKESFKDLITYRVIYMTTLYEMHIPKGLTSSVLSIELKFMITQRYESSYLDFRSTIQMDCQHSYQEVNPENCQPYDHRLGTKSCLNSSVFKVALPFPGTEKEACWPLNRSHCSSIFVPLHTSCNMQIYLEDFKDEIWLF